jgi:oligopeptide/dipeptide ABC transporter ATP-binding protein
MYVGKIVEAGDVKDIFERPQHPYTKALLQAVPEADPSKPPPHLVLQGEVATPIDPPPGCRLCNRCPIADDHCAKVAPDLRDTGNGRYVACHKV